MSNTFLGEKFQEVITRGYCLSIVSKAHRLQVHPALHLCVEVTLTQSIVCYFIWYLADSEEAIMC